MIPDKVVLYVFIVALAIGKIPGVWHPSPTACQFLLFIWAYYCSGSLVSKSMNVLKPA